MTPRHERQLSLLLTSMGATLLTVATAMAAESTSRPAGAPESASAVDQHGPTIRDVYKDHFFIGMAEEVAPAAALLGMLLTCGGVHDLCCLPPARGGSSADRPLSAAGDFTYARNCILPSTAGCATYSRNGYRKAALLARGMLCPRACLIGASFSVESRGGAVA